MCIPGGNRGSLFPIVDRAYTAATASRRMKAEIRNIASGIRAKARVAVSKVACHVELIVLPISYLVQFVV